MSKTKFVGYANRGFWAYDVAHDVFLKHLIDVAEANDQATTPWLSAAISSWRVACVPDLQLTLDADLPATQQRAFIALAEEACARLAERVAIPAEEIVTWSVLNDLRLDTRGETQVLTAPVAELGRAIVALVSGDLPEAPDGKIWLYGTPTGRETLDTPRGAKS